MTGGENGELPAFEKLGVFYLGRSRDAESGQGSEQPILYESRDLTTHGLIVGMTGSGKTGLAVVLLEEAALDGIPAIVIDPKGDMVNLALRFPELRPEDFLPWVDPAEAAREGETPPDLARKTAERWASGIASWGQSKERIQALVNAAEVSVLTPGSTAGRPVAVLRSFAAPAPAVVEDEDALRERVSNTVSALLGLVGIEADPVTSREHVLLANLLDRAWRASRDESLEGLVRAVTAPPFAKLGALDLETFYPTKDRFALATKLNSLLASPAFGAWTAGEPLDVKRLLYRDDGRPRISILSIAHLDDEARMFFVTLLLNEIVGWMRSQEGTGSLRALLYMDEIYGFFPPVKSPPSKAPMLTLLKQARAFGLGVVLATQNPVDLDYKGLANIGTWFLGRLQTARDRDRLLEGLESASGGFDRGKTEELLASLDPRVFLMRNVHEDGPVLFQTRWALSFLRGPLTLEQVKRLSGAAGAAGTSGAPEEGSSSAERNPVPIPDASTSASSSEASSHPSGGRPALASAVEEVFVHIDSSLEAALYHPGVLATVHLHFVDAREQVDHWEELQWWTPLEGDATEPDWTSGRELERSRLETDPRPGVGFADLPPAATREKSYESWRKSLPSYFYRERRLELAKCKSLGVVSRPGESAAEFRARLDHRLREQRDVELETLRKRYAPKLARLEEAVHRAEARVDRESSQYESRKLETAVDFGMTLVGSLFGRKLGSVTNARRASRTLRSGSRANRERQDVLRAEEDLARKKEELAELEAELGEQTRALAERREDDLELETVTLAPRKSDIRVDRVVLAWLAWLAWLA